jgi:ribonuclease D
MTHGQIRRYGRTLLQVIARSKNAPPPKYPRKKKKRPPEVAVLRYDKLRQWRKKRAKLRGVESDVILSRGALWEIACTNPQNQDELDGLNSIGSYRCTTYGEEILRVLKEAS